MSAIQRVRLLFRLLPPLFVQGGNRRNRAAALAPTPNSEPAEFVSPRGAPPGVTRIPVLSVRTRFAVSPPFAIFGFASDSSFEPCSAGMGGPRDPPLWAGGAVVTYRSSRARFSLLSFRGGDSEFATAGGRRRRSRRTRFPYPLISGGRLIVTDKRSRA